VILLLRGGDELAQRRRLQRLKDDADGGTGMLTTNLTQVEGRDARAADIIGPAMTPPFLAPQRLVIVNGFLDRWESDFGGSEAPKEKADGEAGQEPTGAQPAAKGSGASRQPRGLPQFEPLFAALERGLPPSTVLVLEGGAPKRSNAMVARLKRIPGVTEEILNEPRKEALLRFVRDEAAARGVRFRASRGTAEHWESGEWMQRQEADPVALLAGITNGHTLAITNELDKLALYTMGREVTVDDVYTLCSGEREVNQFNLLDAIQDGKAAEALHHLDRLRDEADVDQLIIAMLTTRFRQTATVAELMAERVPETEIARALGNAGRYEGLRKAAMRRAGRVGIEGARAALAAIAEADYRAKKGETKHGLGVELLVLKLSRMAAAR